jgi:4-hydroxy-3-methylbut-2-enyl diphosphate reductase
MKLLIAEPRGFCAGVERAIETVEKVLKMFGAPVWVKHQIVHNRHVVSRLEKMGAIFIEDLNEVPVGSRIIYSAHGVSPEVRKLASERNLIEIDATCGLVTRVHSAAKRFADKGYKIILIGHKDHVEVIGTYGEAPDKTYIVENVDDANALNFTHGEKLFYLTQTTLSLDDVKDIQDALIQKFPNIETLPTSSICYATTNRQLALREITEETDLIIVVGDPMSSNSNRLREVAEKRGVKAFLVNSPEEIEIDWFKDVNVIGLTSGASTPEEVVQDCIQKLYDFGVNSREDIVFKKEDVIFQLPKLV